MTLAVAVALTVNRMSRREELPNNSHQLSANSRRPAPGTRHPIELDPILRVDYWIALILDRMIG
jgi:hypothetical protein